MLRTDEALELLHELCREAEFNIEVQHAYHVIKECLMKLSKIEVIASAKDTAPEHLTDERLLNDIIDTLYDELEYDFEK